MYLLYSLMSAAKRYVEKTRAGSGPVRKAAVPLGGKGAVAFFVVVVFIHEAALTRVAVFVTSVGVVVVKCSREHFFTIRKYCPVTVWTDGQID